MEGLEVGLFEGFAVGLVVGNDVRSCVISPTAPTIWSTGLLPELVFRKDIFMPPELTCSRDMTSVDTI